MGRRKQGFVAHENHVRMLLCGPTVYDYSHIGHARMLLFYDVAARYFRSKKIRVSVVVNITDIDQKIFSKAKATATTPGALAKRFIGELLLDFASLGITDFALACASDHIGAARQLVTRLLKDGGAYSAGGNVYLDTRGIPSFGIMAGMTRKELEDCPLDISPEKKSPLDVLLWNACENFDIAYHDDILGSGIPWWHMQDSSVAIANFAGSYDIHGGASELVYPHHESHLAQLHALTSRDKPVRFWTHVGLVQVKGKKMSKSMHNTVAVRDLLRRHSANALRLYFYSKHYREDFDFAEKDLDKFEKVNDDIAGSVWTGRVRKQLAGKFFKCLANDFDTPRALRVLYEAARARSADLDAMVSTFGLRY